MHRPRISAITNFPGLCGRVLMLKAGQVMFRSGSSICPNPQVELRRFCSLLPTAPCLWLDPRSAAAGQPVPPSRRGKRRQIAKITALIHKVS